MHAHELGKLGEEMACGYLKEKGYQIRERNLIMRGGEIDIVAEKDGRLSFVEVKTRQLTNIAIADSIPPSKIRRMQQAIDLYLEDHSNDEWEPMLLCVEFGQGAARVREIPL